jgi:nucleoside-diphosphate-sugar epimerase
MVEMKACVTGGAGFIGSNLVDRLVADGHEVTVLDNLVTGSRANLERALAHIRFLEGDLRDPAAVADAVAGCEVVFHQGALAAVARSVENPVEVTEVNLGGTVNVLVAARDAGVRRVVFASSSSVYGDTPTLPKTETMPLFPLSPYAASKAAGEAYLAAWHATYGLETVSLRYFNVYGPRQSPQSLYAAVVPRFLAAIAKGEAPVIYGDGQQTRDFTWVGDVVDALQKAATAPGAVGAGPINLGGGERVTILALADLAAQAFGWKGRPRFEPARVGDVRHSLADIGRAHAALGWTPSTPLADGVARLARALQVAHSA